MNNKNRFFICGGDMRQLYLAESLVKDGYGVSLCGFEKAADKIPTGASVKDVTDISEKEIVILPLPCSRDNLLINAPYSESPIKISKLLSYLDDGSIVFGGKLCKSITSSKVTAYDYLNREEMAIANAVPTAEGALQLAMEKLPVTVHGCSCLVLGYGRIGKYLCKLLASMGADVCCEARKFSDLAWIEANGVKAVRLSDLSKYVGSADLIINTVPYMLLDREMLLKVRKNAVIIDLASAPGGVDFAAADQLGIENYQALSLPGKVAPASAGIVIKKTVLNMLEEMGCSL